MDGADDFKEGCIAISIREGAHENSMWEIKKWSALGRGQLNSVSLKCIKDL